MAAFERLGARLRELRYRSGRSSEETALAIEVLASGKPAARAGVAEVVGVDGLDALVAAGAVVLSPETVEPSFAILAGGTQLTIVPLHDRDRPYDERNRCGLHMRRIEVWCPGGCAFADPRRVRAFASTGP
ncbi:MAG TPA: hypothetical protein VK283_00890 [Acidimicrobiales bacterium]|nr:hypothetical protein [Acidimicrobiales bacterium]